MPTPAPAPAPVSTLAPPAFKDPLDPLVLQHQPTHEPRREPQHEPLALHEPLVLHEPLHESARVLELEAALAASESGLQISQRENAKLRARVALVDHFYGAWRDGNAGPTAVPTDTDTDTDTEPTPTRTTDERGARIELLEVALAKSNRDYQKALGRALRAEMTSPR